jgi:hypothetical protein
MSANKENQVNFADCYVLTNNRKTDFILSFLDRFLPNRQEYTHIYEIPEFGENPSMILRSANQLIAYMEHNINEPHGIYWYNKDEAIIRGAMCLFTNDGNVILGIFCESKYPDTSIEDNFLQELKNFAGTSCGLIEYATPAARDTVEFMKRVSA